MRKIYLIIALNLMFCTLHAQMVIDFRLPAAAGSDYCFVFEKGLKRDTVVQSSFDSQGGAQILLPQKYATHRGVAKLFLAGNKNQMVNMILNGEKGVLVATSGEGADKNDFTFTNSPENTALQNFFKRQNELLQQYSALGNSGLSDNSLMVLDSKRRQIEQEYEKLSAEISSTPLFAGKIMQIIRYLTFTGSSLKKANKEVTENLRDFLVNKLDFNDLYVSGFWGLTLDKWYENSIALSDSLFVADARTMLERTNNMEVNLILSQSIINELSKYSQREYLLPAIFSDIKYSAIGQSAPALFDGSDSIVPKSALILFYETGCGNCHNELHNLIEQYILLKNKAVRVITVAADKNKDDFANTAAGFPWSDKLCDFKGFEGKNFTNYGVFGTPTFIWVDKDGIVQGRYARLKEFLNIDQ